MRRGLQTRQERDGSAKDSDMKKITNCRNNFSNSGFNAEDRQHAG